MNKVEINFFILKAKEELSQIKYRVDTRKVTNKMYQKIKKLDSDTVLKICTALLNENDKDLGIMAYDFAFRIKDEYNEKTFLIFQNWLFNYVKGWDDCDDFCTHAFAEFIIKYPEFYDEAFKWTKSKDFWVRRAAAVIFILSIRKGEYKKFDLLKISDSLLNDEHYLVQKGYGWMLKVLSQKEPDIVFNYLKENKNNMPNLSFRYALNKLDKEKKQFLMNL